MIIVAFETTGLDGATVDKVLITPQRMPSEPSRNR